MCIFVLFLPRVPHVIFSLCACRGACVDFFCLRSQLANRCLLLLFSDFLRHIENIIANRISTEVGEA